MKTLIATCLLVSVSVQAQEISQGTASQLQSIIDASKVLKDRVDYAYKGVYGMEDITHWQNLIPSKDALSGGLITWEEAQAYNMSIDDYKAYRIQSAYDDLVEQEQWDADMEMHQAVDNFVNASVAVLEAVAVGEMAAEAQEAGDTTTAENLQTYVTENDVALTQAEVDTYNETLTTVNESAANFAALRIVATSEDMQNDLEAQAQEFGGSVDQVQNVFFDNIDNKVVVEFNQGDAIMIASVDVSAFLSVTNAEFFEAGENHPLYTNGPTQGNIGCLLQASNVGQCTGRGAPPPNTLLWGDYDGDGIMEPMAYTDENGNITDYMAGDEVYDPSTGEYVGKWDENMVFSCENASYCTV